MGKKENQEYIIEKNVPFPKSRGRWKLLHDEMTIGDSILFKSHDEARSFRASVNQSGGKACERHTVDGYRVWLIEKPK